MASRKTSGEVIVPSVLLVLIGLLVWLTAFTDVKEEPIAVPFPPALESRGEGQLSGIAAALKGIDLARSAVLNNSPGDDGLLAGDIEDVFVRYESPGSASSWTVLLRGPIRIRPNTEEEFRIDDGMMVLELSAISGEIAGHFSAGRSFGSIDRSSLLSSLGISPGGFTPVPLELVWPPVEVR